MQDVANMVPSGKSLRLAFTCNHQVKVMSAHAVGATLQFVIVTIEASVPHTSPVNAAVIDVLGRKVTEAHNNNKNSAAVGSERPTNSHSFAVTTKNKYPIAAKNKTRNPVDWNAAVSFHATSRNAYGSTSTANRVICHDSRKGKTEATANLKSGSKGP